MTLSVVLQLLATYGPQILPLIEKLVADFEAGKSATPVTSADIAELTRLCGLTADSIYAQAGVTPPKQA